MTWSRGSRDEAPSRFLLSQEVLSGYRLGITFQFFGTLFPHCETILLCFLSIGRMSSCANIQFYVEYKASRRH